MSGAAETTARQDVALVARREFVERARDKSFLISLAVTTLIIVGVVVLPTVFASPTTYKIGVVGTDAKAIADTTVAALQTTDSRGEIVELADEAAARSAVTAGDVKVALLDSERVFVKDTMGPELSAFLGESARGHRLSGQLTAAGVSESEAAALLSGPALNVTALEPRNEADETRRSIAFITVILLYGQLLGYAMWVGLGVVEEKASRVIEVLAATVAPRRLMTGKVIGIGALGLLQLLVTSVFALAAALTIGDIDIPADAIGAIGLAFVWFLIGFAFFAFLFAGAASLVSRQEDLQNVTTPMTLLMVASLFAGMHASQNPDATLSTVLSFLPPVSAVVMPPRFAAGGVPVWQVLVAYVLMIIATYGVVRLSSRIYTASILKQKSKWREALRASRAS